MILPSKPLKVYVAGPIGHGPERPARVRRAVEAGARLLVAGHRPFVPHLWDAALGSVEAGALSSYGEWMAYDFDWLAACDALVRLSGESPGADREVAEAGRLGIPAYEGVDAFLLAAPSLGPREVTVERSVCSLKTGELQLWLVGPDGEDLRSLLSRSEARELMGQIAAALDGREPAAPSPERLVWP